jgi:hypothetical protein
VTIVAMDFAIISSRKTFSVQLTPVKCCNKNAFLIISVPQVSYHSSIRSSTHSCLGVIQSTSLTPYLTLVLPTGTSFSLIAHSSSHRTLSTSTSCCWLIDRYHVHFHFDRIFSATCLCCMLVVYYSFAPGINVLEGLLEIPIGR